MKDYGAVCLALSLAGAAYWFIGEYLDSWLYQEHLKTVFRADSNSWDEIKYVWNVRIG